MVEPKKNKLWLFDKREREREGIRILRVFRNPDDFGFGEFTVEEIGTRIIPAIGSTFFYVVFGIDTRDGSRSKVMEYSQTHGSDSGDGKQGSGEELPRDA